MTSTPQPEWKLVAQLGDADPIENGGYFVFVDETGVYPPEAEVWREPPDDSETWEVFRVVLDRCTYVDGVLSDNKFHPEFAAWFADEIEAIADFVDNPNLIQWLCSNDPIKRAQAYEAIGLYWGFENFDSEPFKLSRKEIEARYEKHTGEPA